MIDHEQAEYIASLVEQKVRVDEAAVKVGEKKVGRIHYGKRCAILFGVLIIGVIVHYVIEDTGLRAASQSVEMVLAAALDSAFARVREI